LKESDVMNRSKSFHPLQPGFEKNFYLYSEIEPTSSDFSKCILFYYEMATGPFALSFIPVLPDGCTDLVFIRDKNGCRTSLLGTSDSLAGACCGENTFIFGARFAPGKFYSFFPVQACEYLSAQISFDSFYSESKMLTQEVLCADSFQKRIGILEQFLRRNKQNQDPQNARLVSYCVARLITSRGNLTVQQLGKDTAFSTRYLNKLFQKMVGLSPKQFSEILRIQYSVQYIISGAYSNLAEVSAESGYYDQSHMNRACLKYLNCTSSSVKRDSFFTANRVALPNIYSFYS
jgi:AraC-like DNA-binding protein